MLSSPSLAPTLFPRMEYQLSSSFLGQTVATSPLVCLVLSFSSAARLDEVGAKKRNLKKLWLLNNINCHSLNPKPQTTIQQFIAKETRLFKSLKSCANNSLCILVVGLHLLRTDFRFLVCVFSLLRKQQQV